MADPLAALKITRSRHHDFTGGVCTWSFWFLTAANAPEFTEFVPSARMIHQSMQVLKADDGSLHPSNRMNFPSGVQTGNRASAKFAANRRGVPLGTAILYISPLAAASSLTPVQKTTHRPSGENAGERPPL